jgi:trk system potassium uptake protein TrkA
MNIIILGTNQISLSLIENLVAEENDITVIDNDVDLLRDYQNKFDIRTIVGLGSFPYILEKSNAGNTDMLLAVSNNDEVNMLACQVAYSLFNVPIKIARIQTHDYLIDSRLFSNDALPVDVCISPEVLVTRQIKGLIEHPGALQVLDFLDSNLQLVAMKPYYGGQMVGKTLQTLSESLQGLHINVAAIFRNGQSIDLNSETKIKIGDEVFFIGKKSDIIPMMRLLRRMDNPYKSIVVAGGGNIGGRLAEDLESSYRVKVIEKNIKIGSALSKRLNKGIVLIGNCADKELLLSESIDSCDVFCGLTNDDESNILSCIQAKKLGVRQVIALVTNSSYVDLMENSEIDVFVSPQLATISQILTYIRRGDVKHVYSLRRGAAEAIELIAHGDETTSNVVGHKILDLKLPPEIKIVAISRDDEMILPKSSTMIKSEDKIIVFVSNKKFVRLLENLFQVKVNFF